MNRNDSEENQSVALYWDFENLHASLIDDRFGHVGTFDTKDHGYASYSAMVKGLDSLIEVKKGDSDQVIKLRS